MTSRQFDNFDQFSKNYRQIHNQNIRLSGADSNYFSEYKVKEVYQREKNQTLKKILDFGCGDGNSIKYFVKYFPQSHFFGVDISSESIKVAKSKKYPRSSFRVFDGLRLPFEKETFDLVFVAGVLHHANEKHHLKIIREISRVLKRGGKIYLFEHNPLNPLTQKVVRDCVFDFEAKLIPSEKIKKLFQKINFQKIGINYTIFFPRKNIFLKFVPLEKYLTKIPLGGQYYVWATK